MERIGEIGSFTPTVGMIALTAIIWLIWDLVLYFKGKRTISEYIGNGSKYVGAIAFIIGFLCGHWFF
jgi:hypothetical protein